MALGQCLNPNCGKLLSFSKVPLGNPIAWEEPEKYAMFYGICKRCSYTYCADCIENEFSGKCANCGNELEIQGPSKIPYNLYKEHKKEMHSFFPKGSFDRDIEKLTNKRKTIKYVKISIFIIFLISIFIFIIYIIFKWYI